MKSIKECALSITEAEYRKLGGFSYSILATFLRSKDPKVLIEPPIKETDSLLFGSVVDCLITEPETFDERFLVSNNIDISDKLKSVIKLLYDRFPNAQSLNEIPDIEKETAFNDLDYGVSWILSTKLKKLELGIAYYQLLKNVGNKKIISMDDYTRAQTCVYELYNNPFTANYFIDTIQETPNIEHCYQLKFSTIHNGIFIRCMFDKLIVDHDNKTIQPIDLKTTSNNTEQFIHSVLEWSYYIQATMYTQILQDIIKQDDYFKDFTILPFKFIVINSRNYHPLIWEYPVQIQNDIVIDPFESELIKHGYKPWFQLATEAFWHITNNLFDYSYESYQNNGLRTISLFT